MPNRFYTTRSVVLGGHFSLRTTSFPAHCKAKPSMTTLSSCYGYSLVHHVLPPSTSENVMASNIPEMRIPATMILVSNGSTYRHAYSITKIPKSTICSRIQAANPSNQHERASRSRLDTLTKVEEETIVSLLIRYGDRGLPLRRVHLKEAVSAFVSRILPVRRRLLQFKFFIPGD